MTFVVSAKLPIALVHTNEERRVVLVVPVELELEVQHGYVQALGIEIDPTPPWVRRMMSYWSLRKQTANSRRLDQNQRQKSKHRGIREVSQQETSIQQDTQVEKNIKRQKRKRGDLKPENQIGATVHFGPKRLSRKFLESKIRRPV